MTEPEETLNFDPEETPLAVAKLVARLSFNCHALCDDESLGRTASASFRAPRR